MESHRRQPRGQTEREVKLTPSLGAPTPQAGLTTNDPGDQL